MKVLFFSVHRFENKFFGGPASVTDSFKEGLKLLQNDIDVDFQFICISKEADYNYSFTDSHGFKIEVISAKKYHFLDKLFLYIELSNIIYKKKPDIFHSHDFFSSFCGLNSNVPTILTILGLESEEVKIGKYSSMEKTFFKFLKLSLMNFFNNKIKQKVLDKIRFITVPNKYPADVIPLSNKSNYKIIPFATRLDFFKKRLNKNTNISYKLRIISSASISPVKNQLFQIKAIHLLKIKGYNKIELNLVGPHNDLEYYKKIKDYIDINNLDNVKIRGMLNKEELLDFQLNCDVSCLSSKVDLAPISLTESMAIGLPVLGSSVGGMPYMIEEGETGFTFDLNSVERLAAIILYLSENREKLTELSLNCLRKAKKVWHPEKVAAQTINNYRKIYSKINE